MKIWETFKMATWPPLTLDVIGGTLNMWVINRLSLTPHLSDPPETVPPFFGHTPYRPSVFPIYVIPI